MSPSAVNFSPKAAAEYRAAAVRYNQERAGLGAEFAAEVEKAIARLLKFPELGRPYRASTRKIDLARFPYSIIYQLASDQITVVAVAHHKRRPDYWISRS